jgi:hypothetical protein
MFDRHSQKDRRFAVCWEIPVVWEWSRFRKGKSRVRKVSDSLDRTW